MRGELAETLDAESVSRVMFALPQGFYLATGMGAWTRYYGVRHDRDDPVVSCPL